jgi:hypothetical protein
MTAETGFIERVRRSLGDHGNGLGHDAHASFVESADALLRRDRWPDPKWTTQPKHRRVVKYYNFLVDCLRARYVDLQGDFLTAFSNYHDAGASPPDLGTATCVARALERARRGLEQRQPDVAMITNELDQVERYIIWLYPAAISALERPSIEDKLESLPPPRAARYRKQLKSLFDEHGALLTGKDLELRVVYDEVVGAYNSMHLQGQIDAGLGIARLKRFFFWGIGLAILVLIAVPAAIDPQSQVAVKWPYPIPALDSRFTNSWLTAVLVALMGAIGGYLSGLLQAQNTSVTLAQYQHSMIKLRLRPLVGVLVSLTLYILISWSAVVGLTVSGTGALLLLALASGFSERYFLRLIKLDNADTPMPPGKSKATVAAPDASRAGEGKEQTPVASGADGKPVATPA